MFEALVVLATQKAVRKMVPEKRARNLTRKLSLTLKSS